MRVNESIGRNNRPVCPVTKHTWPARNVQMFE